MNFRPNTSPILLCIFAYSFLFSSLSMATKPTEPKSPNSKRPPSSTALASDIAPRLDGKKEMHDFDNIFFDFESILNQYVVVLNTGNYYSYFKYQECKESVVCTESIDRQAFNIEEFDLKKIKTKEQALSFWINAYNFTMIRTILDKGFENKKLKINSVKDFGSFINPYKIFKEANYKIAGKKLSLDNIEKDILLGKEYSQKKWKDARIHFAVNCASVGCPPLLPNIYHSTNIDQVLDKNIELALKSPIHLKIDNNKLYISSLFKWYKDDFTLKHKSILDFITKYIEDSKKKTQVSKMKSYDFIDYNWNLNRKENFK